MAIEFNCPSCFKGYRVADDSAGKRVKCKDCGNAMAVPDISGLSFADEDTGLHKRPAKRHSSTKILPADRPKQSSPQGPMRSLSSGAQVKRNQPSDTLKLDKQNATQARTAKPTPPAPESHLPPAKVPVGLKSPTDLPKLKSAAGRTRVMPEAPKKRMINFVLLVAAAALIVGFFLPWFTLQLDGFGDAVAGFEVPFKAPAFAEALVAAGYGEHPVAAALSASKLEIFTLFALYLVPLLAFYAVINDARCAGRGKSHWWIRILLFIAPALCAAAVYGAFRVAFDAWFAQGGPGDLGIEPMDALNAFGPGAWTFLGGWLVSGLAIFVAPKVKKPPKQPGPAPEPESDDVPDISRPKLPEPSAINRHRG